MICSSKKITRNPKNFATILFSKLSGSLSLSADPDDRKIIEKIERDLKADKYRSFAQLVKDFYYYKKVIIKNSMDCKLSTFYYRLISKKAEVR